VLRKDVDTWPAKLGVEINPAVWSPTVVEIRFVGLTSGPKVVEKPEIVDVTYEVDTYPAVPRPWTVDIRLDVITAPTILEACSDDT
jgi:hypothetical protein